MNNLITALVFAAGCAFIVAIWLVDPTDFLQVARIVATLVVFMAIIGGVVELRKTFKDE